MTVRKDLERLERRRLLRRVRGGAVPAPTPDEALAWKDAGVPFQRVPVEPA